MSHDEAERSLYLSRVWERAVALHDGDQAAARTWLKTPAAALGDERPIDVAQSEVGAREGEELIGRIEQGIVS